MNMAIWNLWHGCKKISPGCKNCYVYRTDAKYGRDASTVRKTGDFDLPIRKTRRGDYKLKAGETVYTCFTSDFFLDAADEWRAEAWKMIKARPELDFLIITKRIQRFCVSLPDDWGSGWQNVAICSTCEDQRRADERLAIFTALPIAHKYIVCEPLLSRIDLSEYLSDAIEGVLVGGESGTEARACDYAWVLDIRNQCAAAGVPFTFRQTGAKLIKDGRVYCIPRRLQHSQAKKAGIDRA